MIVEQLVEMKEVLSEEIKPGYCVVYEKFINNHVEVKKIGIKQGRFETSELLQVLRGDRSTGYSFQSIRDYTLEDDSLEGTLLKIKENHKELFRD
ncbi:hypothetical protein [Desertibacillus haloalkaliphilus]|uniref:hypothetical protein n=1 Tax=Desertibacillus haloalkaliphilus TaxID=1328930 RepID=UPI001C25E093|nr:hypothetical protein [Desertibacillus haloalkaliphilus]MBU8908230.1 hypothetical protein [Desertibacillus haloalkaliphilus]